ncbi:MAG: ABC transporter permease [Clostridia bacterium]
MIKQEKIARVLLIIGIIILVVFAFSAMFPNLVAPYGEKEMFAPWQKPNGTHIFGTNDMGYDIFTELIFATRQTLLVGLISAGFSLALGSAIGIFSGYGKGVLSTIADGVIDVFLVIPKLPLIIVLTAFVGASQGNVIVIIALLSWVGTARVTRAKVVALRKMPFIDALKISGFSNFEIMSKHILKNVKDVIFVKGVTTVTSCIMMESTLSFLGLSDVTKVTWGSMISMAYNRGGFLAGAYNWLLSPGICIMLCILAFFCLNYYFEVKSQEVENRSFF